MRARAGARGDPLGPRYVQRQHACGAVLCTFHNIPHMIVSSQRAKLGGLNDPTQSRDLLPDSEHASGELNQTAGTNVIMPPRAYAATSMVLVSQCRCIQHDEADHATLQHAYAQTGYHR